MATNRVTWDFFVVAGESMKDHAKELVDLLRPRAQVFWPTEDVQPGKAVGKAVTEALGDSGLVLVLCGSGESDHYEQDLIARAVAHHRDDKNRALVPVLWPHIAKPHLDYGMTVLHAVQVSAESGLDPVVDELVKLAQQRRAVWERKARIAIVCCRAELGSDAGNIKANVANLSGVDRTEVNICDAAEKSALEKTRTADQVIVLVGARTGGTDTMKTLMDRGALALGPAKPDSDTHYEEDEMPVARKLRKRDGFVKYPSALDAGKKAADLIAGWLGEFLVAAPGASPVLTDWERQYLKNRVELWHRGAAGGPLQSYGKKRIDRADVYVSLRAEQTAFCWAQEDESVRVDKKRPERGTKEDGEKKSRHPYLERVVSHPSFTYLVLEGEAGSGKSVLLQHIATVLAAQHGVMEEGKTTEDTQLDLETLRHGAPLTPIPLLVEARQIAGELKDDGVGTLCSVLRTYLANTSGRTVKPDEFDAGLRKGRYVILLDSLDEVTNIEHRKNLVHALGCFAGDAQKKKTRVVLTTRPTAHTGIDPVPKGFDVLKLAPVDEKTAEKLVVRWCKTRGHDELYTAEMWNAVVSIRSKHGIETLVENPLLLVCTALVYEIEKTLPESTCDLYYQLVKTLCALKTGDEETAKQKQEDLAQVMFWLQCQGSTAMPVRTLCEKMAETRKGTNWRDHETWLDRLADQTGLLRFAEETVTQGRTTTTEKHVRPWHRSFQEYLSAVRVTARSEGVPELVDLLFGPQKSTDPVAGAGWLENWTATLRFLAGAWGSPDRISDYVARLMDWAEGKGPTKVPSGRQGLLLGLAAAAIADNRRYFENAEGMLRRVQAATVKGFGESGTNWPLNDRLLALDYLGKIDDPRLDERRWIELPGGVFEMGRDRGAYQVAPQHKVLLDPFAMSWCPETVKDYEVFIQEGGYKTIEYWQEFPEVFGQWTQPREWVGQKQWPNRPVVGVTWFEARAYCVWLSRQLGYLARLPTEAEWEYAATFGHNGIWPWDGTGESDPGSGNDARANYDWNWQNEHPSISPPNLPTPVGAFPRGDHSRGFVDLSGNVWEWCLDGWREPDDPSWKKEHQPNDNQPVVNPCHLDDKSGHRNDTSVHRAVRGGSWGDNAGGLRCATRDWFLPRSRDQYLGFRVVLCVSVQHVEI